MRRLARDRMERNWKWLERTQPRLKRPLNAEGQQGCKTGAGKETKKLQRLKRACLLRKLEAAKNAPKEAAPEDGIGYWIGIDLGDKHSKYCFLDKNANIVAEDSLATTVTEFEQYFKAIPRSRIALEVGPIRRGQFAIGETWPFGHCCQSAEDRRGEKERTPKERQNSMPECWHGR